MILDGIVLFITLCYYILDYTLLNFHTNSSTVLLIIAYITDIVIISYVVFRLFSRELSPIGSGILIAPVFWIFKSLFLYVSFLSVLSNIPDWNLLLILVIGYLYLTYTTFFSNKFADKQIIKQRKKEQSPKDVEPYSIFLNENTYIPGNSRFQHVQLIGATGSGKTRFIIYPGIMQDIKDKNRGVFIYDIKSNMREKVEKFIVDSNRDTDYYHFNLGDENSMTYNPLAGDNPGEISNRVFTALYYNMERGEQYYIDIAKEFLSALISVLKKKWKTITFIDLYRCISGPKLHLQPMCNQILEKYPKDLSAKYILDFIKGSDVEKKLSGLLNKVSQFAKPEWAKQINEVNPDIDIAKILEENKILLFQANSGKYSQEYKPLSVLLMMHIQSEISKRYDIAQSKLKPFFLYLDEFDKIIYPDFTELINKAREAKVGIIFGHQALGDLRKYGEAIENTVLQNSLNKVILKINDPGTAEYFAKLLGTHTIQKKVKSFSTKEGESQAGYTLREEEEFVIHPNEFKYMQLGKGIVSIETLKGRIVQEIEFQDIEIPKVPELYTDKKHKNVKKASKQTNFKTAEEKVNNKIKSGNMTKEDMQAEQKKQKGYLTLADLRKKAQEQDKNGKETA